MRAPTGRLFGLSPDRATLSGGEYPLELGPHAATAGRGLLDFKHDTQAPRGGGGTQFAAREPGILLARADPVVERGAEPVAGIGHAADDQPARTKSRPRALRSGGRVTFQPRDARGARQPAPAQHGRAIPWAG